MTTTIESAMGLIALLYLGFTSMFLATRRVKIPRRTSFSAILPGGVIAFVIWLFLTTLPLSQETFRTWTLISLLFGEVFLLLIPFFERARKVGNAMGFIFVLSMLLGVLLAAWNLNRMAGFPFDWALAAGNMAVVAVAPWAYWFAAKTLWGLSSDRNG